jgi:hypothetical protein
VVGRGSIIVLAVVGLHAACGGKTHRDFTGTGARRNADTGDAYLSFYEL